MLVTENIAVEEQLSPQELAYLDQSIYLLLQKSLWTQQLEHQKRPILEAEGSARTTQTS